MIKTIFIIQSSNLKLLSIYISYLSVILKKLNITYTTRFNPTVQKRLTLLKAPHVYKKHKEQFFIKKYSIRLSINILCLSKHTFSMFLRNKPKFVDLNLILER